MSEAAPAAPPERMPDIRVTVMAADANPYGTAFVGWLFGQMSLAGGSLASRRSPLLPAQRLAEAGGALGSISSDGRYVAFTSGSGGGSGGFSDLTPGTYASFGVTNIFVRDRVTHRVNGRLAEMFGYSREEMIGKTSALFYDSEQDWERVGNEAYPRIQAGATYQTEVRGKKRSGESFWMQFTGRLVDPAEESKGTIWVIDDVDARHRAEDALKAALLEEQRYSYGLVDAGHLAGRFEPVVAFIALVAGLFGE